MTEEEKGNFQRKSDKDISGIHSSLHEINLNHAVLANSYKSMDKNFKDFTNSNTDTHTALFDRTDELRNDVTIIQTTRKNKKDQATWLLSLSAIFITGAIAVFSAIKYIFAKVFS